MAPSVPQHFCEFCVELSPSTGEWLSSRAARMGMPVADQVRAELVLLSDLLKAELGSLAYVFTVGEANCVADVCRERRLSEEQAATLHAAVGGALSESPAFADRHGVVGSGLLEKLRALGPSADHALLDAVSRWWHAGGEPTVEGWDRLGLIVREPVSGVAQ